MNDPELLKSFSPPLYFFIEQGKQYSILPSWLHLSNSTYSFVDTDTRWCSFMCALHDDYATLRRRRHRMWNEIMKARVGRRKTSFTGRWRNQKHFKEMWRIRAERNYLCWNECAEIIWTHSFRSLPWETHFPLFWDLDDLNLNSNNLLMLRARREETKLNDLLIGKFKRHVKVKWKIAKETPYMSASIWMSCLSDLLLLIKYSSWGIVLQLIES